MHRNLLINGLVLVFLLTGALAALELLYFPHTKHLSRQTLLMGFSAVPNQYVGGVRINASGFAGSDPESECAPPRIKVLLLGGSVLFNRRFADRLERRLYPLIGPNCIVGAALRAHTTWSSLYKYQLLRKYRFDAVLVYEGINDLYANNVPAQTYSDRYEQLGEWYVRGPLLDRSLVWRYAFNQYLYKPVPWVRFSPNEYKVHTAGIFRKNLEWLIANVRADGGTPLLGTFAWHIPPGYNRRAFLHRTLGYVNPEHYDEVPIEVWGDPGSVAKGLKVHNQIVREIGREDPQLKLIDFEKAFEGKVPLFGDICHWNRTGVEMALDLAANAISQSVISKGRRPAIPFASR